MLVLSILCLQIAANLPMIEGVDTEETPEAKSMGPVEIERTYLRLMPSLASG